MSDRVTSSSVEVTLDPATAFDVFTKELDFWWLRGPINNWDAARVTEMRCEPGVDGRLLEIYDEAQGDMLELARITAWEPGRRLAWRSSVDDVWVEVTFEPAAIGTRVRLVATLLDGGRDMGGTSFTRVTPSWFASWAIARDEAPARPREHGRLGLAVFYDAPVAATHWMRDVFGFEPAMDLPSVEGDGDGWLELRAGNAPLMVFKKEAAQQVAAPSHVPWVFVDDLEAHLEHARRRGARIVNDIERHGYRAYTAEDLEGNHWRFAQARPTMRS